MGNQFTLTFRIRKASAADIRIPWDVRFPSSVVLLGGPGITPVTVRDPVDGSVEGQVRVQYVFRAVRAGRSVIGPITYYLRETPYETAAEILEIALQRGPELVPFDLHWRIVGETVFEGQTVAAVLEMSNLTRITVPETVSVTPPSGGVFEEAKGLGTIQSLPVGARDLYRVPVASYLLTPQSAGRLVLPSARVSAQGTAVNCEALAVTVRPLPDAVKDTGAVGSFRVGSRLDRMEAYVNEPARLFIRIEGEGNLHFLQLPEIVFPGFSVTGRTDRMETVAVETGYQGFREWDLRLTPEKTGNLEITIPPYPWLDPVSGKISTSPEQTLTLPVKERKAPEKKIDEGPAYPVLRAEEILMYEPVNAYKNPFMYGFFLPGLFLLGYGMYRRSAAARIVALGVVGFLLLGSAVELRDKSLALVEMGTAAFERNEHFEAIKQFSLALEGLPDSPGIHYNLGLTHRALKNVPRALFHLRKASLHNPRVSLFRDVLSAVEKEYGLSLQIPLPKFHPDQFFWFLIFVYTLMCSLPLLARNRGARIIGLLLLLVPAGLAGWGLLHFSAERDASWGIVGQANTELRKIPLPKSSEWIYLEEGTIVEIHASSSGYLLVKTGFGVEGWISVDKMLVDWGRR
jgi:tetratricopeptide (TPR) repeat protein